MSRLSLELAIINNILNIHRIVFKGSYGNDWSVLKGII